MPSRAPRSVTACITSPRRASAVGSPAAPTLFLGLRGSQWVLFRTASQRRKERCDDLELEVVLVAVAVGAALEDADLVVEPLDQAEADLVLGSAVRGDAITVALDHGRELPVGREPLPLQALLPAVEEGTRPALGLVAPELAEGLLEQVGDAEPFVRCQQLLEAGPAVVAEVLAARKQGVALPLDEGPVLAREPAVLAAAHLIERIRVASHAVTLAEDDAGLGRVPLQRVAEGLPHVHRGELDARRLLRAQRGEEEIEVRLGAALAAHPDRPAAVEVAHHDAVVVALADGDLVDADGPRCGHPGAGHLLRHVDLVEVLHRAVVQALQLGHRLVRHLPTERADVHRVPLREARVLRQPVEPLYVHAAAPPAVDAPALELDVDPPPGHREVAGAVRLLVVTAPRAQAALSAARSFFRRRSTMTRAYRSPNTPARCERATKPGNENSARMDLGAFTVAACPSRDTTFKHGQRSRNPREQAASCIMPRCAGPFESAKTQMSRPSPTHCVATGPRWSPFQRSRGGASPSPGL